MKQQPRKTLNFETSAERFKHVLHRPFVTAVDSCHLNYLRVSHSTSHL